MLSSAESFYNSANSPKKISTMTFVELGVDNEKQLRSKDILQHYKKNIVNLLLKISL
jgi:hypothetical protein